MQTSSLELTVKSWKVRCRFLMFLKPRRNGVVSHGQMLKLARQIDAHRKDAPGADEVVPLSLHSQSDENN